MRALRVLYMVAIFLLFSSGSHAQTTPPTDIFDLWNGGTQLRGMNIWQRLVIPDIDGDTFLGDSRVGPPYTQADFDHLAALGANYVNVSGPGFFTENPPYVLDRDVQANWDHILRMIANANMYAVISLRTGPGRSDFTFYADEFAEWGDPSLINDDVWQNQNAQDAWVAMWQHVAMRYQNNPVVIGYDLMVEPNAAARLLDIYNPDEFYTQYAGTSYDWNTFYPRMVASIRSVDMQMPILVSAPEWGNMAWLPYLKLHDDSRIVYTVHLYDPFLYTHQDPQEAVFFPGEVDADYDGNLDYVDEAWVEASFAILDAWQQEHNMPVAVNEYGVVRWVPGGDRFIHAQMEALEGRGINHALWAWNPSWQPFDSVVDAFDYWHGSDANHHSEVQSTPLTNIIIENWSRNDFRPFVQSP
ncbi:MAG: cellulase family glycosylhydrolase [Chloroflexota bacterium]